MTGGETAIGRDGLKRPPASFLQRGRVRLLEAAAWFVPHLPERALAAVAIAAGEIWYRATPARARQARLNLGRVAANLAATGRGPRRVRAASDDPRRLEGLVREAYRQAVRYYLDMIRVSVGARLLTGRLAIETPETVERLLGACGPVILVGLHFGALEIPTLYLAERSRREIVVPMETLADPAIQAWLVRTRGRSGVRLIPLERARSELAVAIERDQIVGLVADRDLSGSGIPVPLFGAAARLPAGPALLAVEAGLPVFVGAVRRAPGGRWIGRLDQIDVASEGPRRQRLTTTLTTLAAAFERLVADAPEQWWTLFFPIWDDLVVAPRETARPRRGVAGGSPPAGEAA